MTNANLLHGKSGRVAAVINATASAVIGTARQHPLRIDRVYAARNGIFGVVREEMTSLSNRLAFKRCAENRV